MTEDYAIQQQKSSALPAVLGVTGGITAAALGAKGPQWAKEKAKYASFEDIINESKDDFVKNNEGIAEQAVTDFETAKAAIDKAGKDYDTQLSEYLEKNKAGVTPELAADDPAAKALKDAEAKLAAKRAELEKAAADRLRAIKPKAEGEKLVKFKNVEDSANYWIKKLYNANADASGKKVEANFESWANRVVENFYSADIEKQARKTKGFAKKSAEEQAKIISGLKAEKVKEIKTGIMDKVVELDKLPKIDKTNHSWITGDAKVDSKKADQLISINEKRLADARASISKKQTEIADLKKQRATKVGKKKAPITQRINELEKEVEKLYVEAGDEIVKIKELKTLKADIAKAYTPQARYNLPKTSTMEAKVKTKPTTALTEEQIAEQAKKAITDDMVKAEQDAVNNAKKAAEEARAKLPKVEGKPVEDLTKEFVEKNGTREEAIKKATDAQKEKVGNELKALLEKGKIKGGKMALITAAGVGAGALLGLMFAPKNKSV